MMYVDEEGIISVMTMCCCECINVALCWLL